MAGDESKYENNRTTDHYQRGSHLYIRDEAIDLYQTFTAPKGLLPNSPRIRYLHIYCDKLTYSGPLSEEGSVVLDKVQDGQFDLRYMHIYAREFLSLEPKVRQIYITHKTPMTLLLVYDKVSPLFILGSRLAGSALGATKDCEVLETQSRCSKGEECHRTHFVPSEADAGLSLFLENGVVECNALPNVQVQEIDPVGVDEMSTFGPDILRTDNLTCLLQHTFNSAATAITDPESDIDLIVSKLRLVMRCTKGSVALVNLAVNAKILHDRLKLPLKANSDNGIPESETASTRLFVPDLTVKEYLPEIKTRLEIITDIENKLEQGSMHQHLVDLFKQGTGHLFEGLKLSVRGSADTSQTDLADASSAIMDVYAKQEDMEKYQAEAQAASDRFQNGLDSYALQQKQKFQKEVLKSVGEIAIGIVATVCTLGASAPATVGAVMGIVNNTFEMPGKWANTKKILTQLIKTMAAIYPKLSTTYSKQSGYSFLGGSSAKTRPAREKDAIANLKKDAAKVTSKIMPPATSQAVDYIGLTADWESFKTDIDATFASLESSLDKGEVIDGMSEFKTALRKQAIRGQALLEALRKAQDAQGYYLRQVAERDARKERDRLLHRLGETIVHDMGSESKEAWLITRAILKSDLLSAKQTLFAMLHRASLALIYGSSLAGFPSAFANPQGEDVRFTPGMRAVRFKTLYAELEARMNDRIQSQTYPVTVGTRKAEGAIFHDLWRELLRTTGAIGFRIPVDLKLVKGKKRLRIYQMNATFHGLRETGSTTPAINPPISYTIELGPTMCDRGADGRFIQYWMQPRGLLKSGDGNRLINTGGEFAKTSLFCQGEVRISKEDAEGWDLESVTDVSLNFKCELPLVYGGKVNSV